MTALVACPRCHARYDPARGGGLCPACALASAFGPEDPADLMGPTAPTDVPAAAALFAGHEILGEIARGGMGVVYRARQFQPPREVALKCLTGLALGRAGWRERFHLEARALAALEHPSILPIYQFGEEDGVPYFTMKLAGGGTLGDRLTAYRGNWKEIAALMRVIAGTVQFAHDHGVLHRDLKPGNLLFDEAGRVLVADFGLAQSQSPEAEECADGRVVSFAGTPAYLPPEVKRGEAFTAAGDVWSLGAVFYELLAQQPYARAEDVVPVTVWPVAAPRDLVAIGQKALAPELALRYRAARDFADDLRRWEENRPVTARPASPLRRVAYWARRHVALAASSVVVLGALTAFLLMQWRTQRHLRHALGQSLLHEASHLRALDRPERVLELLRRAAPLLPPEAGAAWRTEAAAVLALPTWKETRRWSVPNVELGGREAFSPELDHYVVADPGGAYRVFDTSTGREARHHQAGSASGASQFSVETGARRLVSWHDDGLVEIAGPPAPWRFQATSWSERMEPALHPDGRSFLHVNPDSGAWLGTPEQPEGHAVAPAPVARRPLALDPAGARALLWQGDPPRAGLWSVAEARELIPLPGTPAGSSRAAWSPDGHRLAIGSAAAPYGVQIFDTRDGRLRHEWFDHQLPVTSLAWHPDGEALFTLSGDARLVWRSLAPGGFRLVRTAGERALTAATDGRRLGFSPANGWLGLAELTPSAVYRVWPESESVPDPAPAYRSALSADAAWLAIAGPRSLRLWDVAARRETARWAWPGPASWAEAYFLGDDLYIGALGEGSDQPRQGLWKTSVEALRRGGTPVRVGGPDATLLGTSPDQPGLVVAEAREKARAVWLWPDADPARARRLAGDFPLIGYRLLHGGRWGFTSHWSEPDIWLWNPATGERAQSLGLPEPAAGEPSPDGRWLFTGTASECAVWDTATWQRAATWPAAPGLRDTFLAAFSPDSRWLALGLPNGLIELRAVPDGALWLTLTPPGPCRLSQILFHPQGDRLFVLLSEGRVAEWHLAELRRALEKLGAPE